MNTLSFELPYPPSVNAIYRHTERGVVLTKAVRAYRLQVGKFALAYSVPRWERSIKGRLWCEIRVCPPTKKRKRDLDNILKAVLDALQHCGVLEDDERIDHLSVTRNDPSGTGKLLVKL